jgi:hypothetical protein
MEVNPGTWSMSEEQCCYGIRYQTDSGHLINQILADFEGPRQRIVCYEGRTYEMIACTKERTKELFGGLVGNWFDVLLLGTLTTKDGDLELDKHGVWLFFSAIDICNRDAVYRLMQEGYTSVRLLNRYPPTREDFEKLGFCMFHKNKLYTIVRERAFDDVQYAMQ